MKSINSLIEITTNDIWQRDGLGLFNDMIQQRVVITTCSWNRQGFAIHGNDLDGCGAELQNRVNYSGTTFPEGWEIWKL